MLHCITRSALIAALSTSLLALPVPLHAQVAALSSASAPAAAAVADPHQEAMSAILASADETIIIDNFVRTFAAELPKADPRIATLEAQKPGLALAIAEGLRPVFKPFSERITGEFRGKVVALMRETLTGDEAQSVAIIFSSPAMKKMMRIAVSNYTQTNVLREAMRGDGTVTAQAADADNRAAVRAAMEEMTPADFAELAKLPMNPALGRKLQQLQPRITALRIAMENAELLPQEEQMIQDAVEAAMVKFLADAK